MSSSSIVIIFRFFVLIFLQVALFNKIDFLGYLNPFPYVLYIILFPVNGNKFMFLSTTFLLGLTLDMFADTGGIHAFSSIILAYIKPNLMRFSFGVSYEYQTIKIAERVTSERISLILLSVFIHHFLIYSVELVKFGNFLDLFLKTFVNTIFTSVICILTLYLIKPSSRR